MHYKLHRIAPNSEGWNRPSPGRLGAPGAGSYVRENGFGYEDWNFAYRLARDGTMLGYTRARPARKFMGDEFRIILATYDFGVGWRAVGYYDGASYKEFPPVHLEPVIDLMASEVFQLAQKKELASRYNTMTQADIRAEMAEENKHSFEIPVEKVVVFKTPVQIDAGTFAPGRQRMEVSFDLSEQQFDTIIAGATPIIFASAGSREFEEGGRRLRRHYAIERNQLLITAFKRGLHSFACTICAFNFEADYGEIGKQFIECHHTRPLAQMNPDGDTTSPDELIAVCSNCHRMLHRHDTLVTADALRRMRREANT